MKEYAEHITLNIGPLGSAAIGPLRMNVETDGEVVFGANPDLGCLHRGLEKIAERMTWMGFLPFTDRLDYLAASHCNLAYALAVEKLAGIEISDRVNQIRVAVNELNRIASHLLAVGKMAEAVGLPTASMYALRDRERVNNLFEVLCGARLTYSYIRIGGVAADITDGFVEKTHELLDYLQPKLKEYHDILSNNSIFRGRLSGLGIVPLARAIEVGLSGPVLRASGLKHDVRKVWPYSGYDRYDFSIPVGTGAAGAIGDAFDRYFVRLREIEQSILIARQALTKIPDGPFQVTLPKVFKPPAGEAYVAVESPRGLLGVYVNSTGEKNPMRVKFRTPSFATMHLFPEVLEGKFLSDVSSIIASFDIAVSEVDR